ncbi:hypothetical protein WB401_25490 [Streptomyces brasiliscabiei]|uniref:Uncharacterized protein n=1 Tax=Streptomyces brasiliscabiei TaxID=2736302 RepID=A0ABU8GFT8_9ACTN
MKIAACVKYVPDTTGDRRFRHDRTVDRVGVGVGVGMDVDAGQAVDAVRRALRTGVDHGAHVQDDALAGSDAIATSRVLAQALRRARHGMWPGAERRARSH